MADLFTPAVTSDIELADPNSRLAYWKQILPKKGIHYTAKDGSRQFVNFDDGYLADLAKMEGIDSIGFLLADPENKHNMDPERWRGKIVKMEVRDGEKPGLYGKVVFPNAQAAAAVLNNPELGVSARIRENIAKSDGTTVRRGIIHVLGTLDPQIEGMEAWEKADADLSTTEEDMLDLSNENYEEAEAVVATKKTEGETKKKKTTLAEYTLADVDAMEPDELDSFLAEFAPEFAGTLSDEEPEGDEDDDESDEDPEGDPQTEDESHKELVGAGADMSKVQADIDLANSRAAFAESQAREALTKLAATEWEKTRNEYLAKGVPAHALDLAAPVLARGGEMVIDLSNSDADEDEIDMAKVVTGLLDAMEGFIDLSTAEGHSGVASLSDTDTYDEQMLAKWKI